MGDAPARPRGASHRGAVLVDGGYRARVQLRHRRGCPRRTRAESTPFELAQVMLLKKATPALSIADFRLMIEKTSAAFQSSITNLQSQIPNPMTQLESARKGIVTPEMEFVARREDLHPELVRSEV